MSDQTHDRTQDQAGAPASHDPSSAKGWVVVAWAKLVVATAIAASRNKDFFITNSKKQRQKRRREKPEARPRHLRMPGYLQGAGQPSGRAQKSPFQALKRAFLSTERANSVRRGVQLANAGGLVLLVLRVLRRREHAPNQLVGLGAVEGHGGL